MGFSDDDRHQIMADSWLDAIKDYLSANTATEDWAFAWMLDENSEILKFVKALKENDNDLVNAIMSLTT